MVDVLIQLKKNCGHPYLEIRSITISFFVWTIVITYLKFMFVGDFKRVVSHMNLSDVEKDRRKVLWLLRSPRVMWILLQNKITFIKKDIPFCIPTISYCLLLKKSILKMNVTSNWTVKNNTSLQKITSITESTQPAYLLLEFK